MARSAAWFMSELLYPLGRAQTALLCSARLHPPVPPGAAPALRPALASNPGRSELPSLSGPELRASLSLAPEPAPSLQSMLSQSTLSSSFFFFSRLLPTKQKALSLHVCLDAKGFEHNSLCMTSL